MANLEINIRQANADFVAIKEKIVAKGVEVAEGTRTTEYAQKVDEVYEAGKKAERIFFFNTYQNNGNRTDYQRGFGIGFDDTNFYPNHDIKPVGNAAEMFANCGITDLMGRLEEQGVSFDFSQVTYTSSTFKDSQITRIPVLNISNISNCSSIFTNAKNIVWVEGVILNEGGGQNFGSGTGSNWTLYSANIEHLPILGGTIGQNCYFNSLKKLDKVSITSIINALSTTTSGLTVTLSTVAVNKAFETSEGANDGIESAEWKTLKETKSNWNIGYA